MDKKARRLVNSIDKLYDTAYSVLEKQERDSQELYAVMIERNIYKEAFNQLKRAVCNINLANLSESNKSAEYNMGKINAYLNIINEIEIIEEINGLVPNKQKNKGDFII